MVLYVVDYGVSAITDNAGALVGYQRQFHYGWVAYYRDTGPVAGYERLLALAGKRPSKGSAVVRYALTSTSPSPWLPDIRIPVTFRNEARTRSR